MPELVIDPSTRMAWLTDPDGQLTPIRNLLRMHGSRWHKQRWEIPQDYRRIKHILSVLDDNHIEITATAGTQKQCPVRRRVPG